MGDTKVFVDKDGHYAGWSGKGLGSERIGFFDGEQNSGAEPVTKRGMIGGWIFLGIVLGLITLFIILITK